MIVRRADPGEMTHEARTAELAGLLVRGYRRMEIVRQNSLEAEGAHERPCDHAAVDSRNPKKEVA